MFDTVYLVTNIRRLNKIKCDSKGCSLMHRLCPCTGEVHLGHDAKCFSPSVYLHLQ